MTFLLLLILGILAVVGYSQISKKPPPNRNIEQDRDRGPVQDLHRKASAAPTRLASRSPVLLPADPRVTKWVGWNFCGHLDVVGVQFRKDDAIFAYNNAAKDDEVELRRDPNNIYDENAISVWVCSRHVGFIDKETAKAAVEILPKDMPIRGRFVSGWIGDAGYVRLTFLPLMPDIKSRRANNWDVPGRT